MAMILPERTVDAWVATYITGRYWRARLWAPPEKKEGERYDLTAGLRSVSPTGASSPPPAPPAWPEKVFVFEHKGVYAAEGTGAGVVHLGLEQFLIHLAEDRARGGNLIFYLLPDPYFLGPQFAPAGSIPDFAKFRTRGPLDPSTGRPEWKGFGDWARVIHVEDLLRHLYVRATTTSGGGDRLTIPTAELQTIAGFVSLRDFIGGVRACEFGQLAGGATLPNAAPEGGRRLAKRLNGTAQGRIEALAAAGPTDAQVDGPIDRHAEVTPQPDGPEGEGILSYTTVYGLGG